MAGELGSKARKWSSFGRARDGFGIKGKLVVGLFRKSNQQQEQRAGIEKEKKRYVAMECAK